MKSIPCYNFFRTKYGDELLIDVVELKLIKKYINETPIHTLAYYDITFVTSGNGFFSINDQTYEVASGDVIFSRPGEIRTWDKEGINDGYALIFDEEFLLSFFNDPFFLQNMLYFNMERVMAKLSLDEAMSKRLLSLTADIRQEINCYKVKDKHLLRALLYEILTLLNREYKEANPLIAGKSEKLNRYVKQFMDLVNFEFRKNRSVCYYADKLCVTPNYLNEIINKVMGVNAKLYILNRLVLESKKMLIYSSLSISEISEKLNFDTVSYFVRFFRKRTGQTPLQYRNNIR